MTIKLASIPLRLGRKYAPLRSPMPSILFTTSAVGVVLLLLVHPVGHAIGAPRDTDTTASLSSDTIIITSTGVNATGNLSLDYLDTHVTSSNGSWNFSDSQVTLDGNIQGVFSGNQVNSSSITFNTVEQTAIFNDTTLFIEPYYNISACSLESIGKNVYSATGVVYTTCSATNPDWSIAFKDATLRRNRDLSGRNVLFYVKSAPVFYLPYFRIPLREERTTGFLPPKYATSNTNGFAIAPAFFWNISADKDITAYTTLYTNASALYGIQGRYAISDSEGINLEFDYSKDRVDFYSLENRWHFASQTNFDIGIVEFRLRADYASDIDFWNVYNEFFLFTPKASTAPEGSYYFQALAGIPTPYADIFTYYDRKTIFSSSVTKRTTIEQIPGIEVSKNIHIQDFVSVTYTADATRVTTLENLEDIEFTYDNYSRYQVNLSVYKVTPFYLGYITPQVSFYSTQWFDREQIFSIGEILSKKVEVDDAKRNIAAFNLPYSFYDLSTSMQNLNLHHTLTNKLTYKFVQNHSTVGQPNFITEDRISPENSLTYRGSSRLRLNKHNLTNTIQPTYDITTVSFNNIDLTSKYSYSNLFTNYASMNIHSPTELDGQYSFVDNATLTFNNFQTGVEYSYRDIKNDNITSAFNLRRYNTNINLYGGIMIPSLQLSYKHLLANIAPALLSTQGSRLVNTGREASVRIIRPCWYIEGTYAFEKAATTLGPFEQQTFSVSIGLLGFEPIEAPIIRVIK